jgi:DNA invertase Pin-like site-specific DNA recombinase
MAAYTRVSTNKEEQHLSYENQCAYYTDYIQKNPEWRFAGIFADEGISGTSTKKRDGFNRMIRQCRAGRIDLIITNAVITKGQFL